MPPTAEESEDFVADARYGELADLEAWVAKHGWDAAFAARDDRGNSALHVSCAQGHVDKVRYLLDHVPAGSSEFLLAKNEAGSAAIHWAANQNHIECLKALVEFPEDKGGGPQQLKIANGAGSDAWAIACMGSDSEPTSSWIMEYNWRQENPGKYHPEFNPDAPRPEGGAGAEDDNDDDLEDGTVLRATADGGVEVIPPSAGSNEANQADALADKAKDLSV